MILKSQIADVALSSMERIITLNSGVKRIVDWDIINSKSYALIVSGIRRCGKSTLMRQMISGFEAEKCFFINLDDPRLFGFDLNDFNRVYEIIEEGKYTHLFLDEIQLVPNWERFIRLLTDSEKYHIVISGSNASMLSKELGTHLTGRHISKELFPFSYNEFRIITNLNEASAETTKMYLNQGGFPEYLKTNNHEVLSGILNDIIYRDISVRFGIRNHLALKQLAIYLVSNAGNLLTANSLRKVIPIAATSTVMEYLNYFENAYLAFFVPKFSYSYTKQIQNPRKIYCIDTGMITVNTVSFSLDDGRRFENLIFLSLRRETKEIYYYAEKGECDFVVCQNNQPINLIQACFNLTSDNLNRELEGLYEAMQFFNINEGTIVTLDQNDHFEKGNMQIAVLPFHKWIASF